MKIGDLVYFDAFYHNSEKYRGLHPSKYAILGVVVRECNEKDDSWVVNVKSWKQSSIYEVFADNICFPAPAISLILADQIVK